MTVRELIEFLQTCDQDLPVEVQTYSCGADGFDVIAPEDVTVGGQGGTRKAVVIWAAYY